LAASSTHAYVLRTVEYGDRDIIVTLFGRSTGKFGAIAKNAAGSKQRFGGGLQPMRRLEAAYIAKPNRDLARLDEIGVVDDHAAIQSDYDKITIGSYVTDFVRHVTVEDDPMPALFDLTAGLFERLADAEPKRYVLEVLLHHFQLRALRLLGAAPTLDHCFRCGRVAAEMDKLRAVRSGEGVVCGACRRTGEAIGVLFPGTVAVLEYIRSPDADAPEALEQPRHLEQARRLVDAAVERVLDRPLKSRAMLVSVLGTD